MVLCTIFQYFALRSYLISRLVNGVPHLVILYYYETMSFNIESVHHTYQKQNNIAIHSLAGAPFLRRAASANLQLLARGFQYCGQLYKGHLTNLVFDREQRAGVVKYSVSVQHYPKSKESKDQTIIEYSYTGIEYFQFASGVPICKVRLLLFLIPFCSVARRLGRASLPLRFAIPPNTSSTLTKRNYV